MISFVLRSLKRLLVLLPALLVAYVSIFNIFPVLNDALPVVLAVLLTYLLGAYILVPAVIRLVRIVFPVQHLPHYCVTADGFASDPLNVGIIGTRDQVVEAMETIGWHAADKLTLRSSIIVIFKLITKRGYRHAPMSSLYLFGRKQDLAFQLPIKQNSIDSRHHVRFWATSYDALQQSHIQSRSDGQENDRLLWVGAASRDIGITFIRHNAQITHLVDPDTDRERDLIVQSLTKDKRARLEKTITLTEPYRLLNIHALRGHVNSDAKFKIISLPTTVRTKGSGLGSSKLPR